MKTTLKVILLSAFAAVSVISCADTVDGDGNGLTPGSLDASFTITETSANNYTFTANDQSYLFSRWDMGDGAGFYKGKMEESVFFPDAGTYEIVHEAVGQGGVVGGTVTQTLVVATSDPVSGNLVKGGNFSNSDDWSEWTINVTNTSGAQWTFTEGKATLTATGWAGQGIYQPIDVVAGRSYKIDMIASSTTGCTDTWFQVFVGYDKPVQGQDYSGDGTLYREISTWAGQGTTPFSGKISVVGQGDGVFTASKTGTVYLGIRGGGADMGAGISITGVEFRGIN